MVEVAARDRDRAAMQSAIGAPRRRDQNSASTERERECAEPADDESAVNRAGLWSRRAAP